MFEVTRYCVEETGSACESECDHEDFTIFLLVLYLFLLLILGNWQGGISFAKFFADAQFIDVGYSEACLGFSSQKRRHILCYRWPHFMNFARGKF